MHYKELSSHTVWLPSIDPEATPLVHNPQGIQLFQSAPLDPLVTPPNDVPLRSV